MYFFNTYAGFDGEALNTAETANSWLDPPLSSTFISESLSMTSLVQQASHVQQEPSNYQQVDENILRFSSHFGNSSSSGPIESCNNLEDDPK